MKIAVSSATFAAAFSEGRTTQLEWLDACANELEVDGIVLDLGDFPRTDREYLAQLKKSATDLGLTIAAIAIAGGLPTENDLTIAITLGAPIAIGAAPIAHDDAAAWGAFVESARLCARAAKRAGVVVGLRNLAGTLCANAADLKRISYDVDGSWLRYALDPLATSETDDATGLLSKAVIVTTAIGDRDSFARDGDERARLLIDRLARYRGFIELRDDGRGIVSSDYHDAIARFARLRSTTLSSLDRI